MFYIREKIPILKELNLRNNKKYAFKTQQCKKKKKQNNKQQHQQNKIPYNSDVICKGSTHNLKL